MKKTNRVSPSRMLYAGSIVTLFILTLLILCCASQDDKSDDGVVPGSTVDAANGPAAGNPDGHYAIPPEAAGKDISSPDQTVGDGTAESCTSDAFIAALAKGGTIVFDCGDEPVTITLDQTAKIYNNGDPDVVVDGGGLVTLSGGGKARIIYMNTCDESLTWTTSHCDNQDHPRLTLQNITLADGNASGEEDGGGALFARGGSFTAINCRFFNNICAETGADVGGGAIRLYDQYNDQPVYIVNSTFGGAQGYGNSGANGGAISSIGVSWKLINSLFSYNSATGNGGNPAEPGTPGGGSGGAVYNDGNTMTLSVLGSKIESNSVKAYGSAIFFVSNDHSGDIVIDQSTIRENTGGSWYPVYPGISMHDDTKVTVTDSVIE